MFIWQSRDQISSQSCSRRRGRPESSCPALFPPTHRPRSEVEKSSWDQNQQSTTVLNSHLQGCWYWDNEETAWQGKHLSTDQLTTKISESGPHKMIFCNFWPIAHCIVWSAGELDSPDRQGGFFHQGGAAGVQTKCSFFFISKNFEIGQKILFYKFSSDLQPTGKREDLIPQLHHVPQPGWGNKSFSAYLETKS